MIDLSYVALQSDRPIAEVAKNLGVNEKTLRTWTATAKDRGEVATSPLSTSERAELARLRKENAQLQMDVSFLGKAAAWFASRNK
jgi:transposase